MCASSARGSTHRISATRSPSAMHSIGRITNLSAPFNPPVKNEDFKIRIALEDMNNGGQFKSNPTIVAGDFKVDKDGGGHGVRTQGRSLRTGPPQARSSPRAARLPRRGHDRG